MEQDQILNRAHLPILVVEDDGFFRNVVRSVLSSVGFQDITEADSGRSAVALLSKRSFQVILSDVQMPLMNGLELLQQIRSGQTPAPRDTRVIILTSFSNTEVLGSALALDVNGFLVKPMKPNDVLTKISGALNETINLRSEIVYKSINTNLDILTVQSHRPVLVEGGPPPPKQGVATAGYVVTSKAVEKPNNRKQVPLLELKPGALVAEDILFKNGNLLLPAGLRIDQVVINRLLELRILLKEDSVWVGY